MAIGRVNAIWKSHGINRNGKIMSAEYPSVDEIPFHTIDKRLEKDGIEMESGGIEIVD
jgi:hypothetical protein